MLGLRIPLPHSLRLLITRMTHRVEGSKLRRQLKRDLLFAKSKNYGELILRGIVNQQGSSQPFRYFFVNR